LGIFSIGLCVDGWWQGRSKHGLRALKPSKTKYSPPKRNEAYYPACACVLSFFNIILDQLKEPTGGGNKKFVSTFFGLNFSQK